MRTRAHSIAICRPGCIPVTVLDNGTLRDADPGISLAAGDRITLLAPAARTPAPSHPRGGQPAPRPADAPAAGQELRTEDGGRRRPPADCCPARPGLASLGATATRGITVPWERQRRLSGRQHMP